ncbi:MAG: hypothetical protein SFY80_13935 [Verrucomicrobiota bacterium]|nr:hypothetical protein [Verrucomicrobiota bacterium]
MALRVIGTSALLERETTLVGLEMTLAERKMVLAVWQEKLIIPILTLNKSQNRDALIEALILYKVLQIYANVTL